MNGVSVSIIIPLFNTVNYFRACLQSILDQSFSDFEVIVVDDGSTDGGSAIAEEVSLADSRFRVFRKANAGQSSARNFGLTVARGDYILFLDSDDVVQGDMLATLHEQCKLNALDVCLAGLDYVSESYEPMHKYRFDRLRKNALNDKMDVLFEYGLLHPSPVNAFFKRDLFLGIRFPEGMYFEDLATIFLVILKAERIYYIDEGFYKYVQRPGSTLHSFSHKKIEDCLLALDMVAAGLKSHTDRRFRRYFFVSYLWHAASGLPGYIERNSAQPLIDLHILRSKLNSRYLRFGAMLHLFRLDILRALMVLLFLGRPSIFHFFYTRLRR